MKSKKHLTDGNYLFALIMILTVMLPGGIWFCVDWIINVDNENKILFIVMLVMWVVILIYLAFMCGHMIQTIEVDEEKIVAKNFYGIIQTVKWDEVINVYVKNYYIPFQGKVQCISLDDGKPRVYHENPYMLKNKDDMIWEFKIEYTKKFTRIIQQYCDKEFQFIDCKDKFNKS